MEATKVNSIMTQLDDSDVNRHVRNTNIHSFVLIFESDEKEGTKHRMKPKTPIIVLSKD